MPGGRERLTPVYPRVGGGNRFHWIDHICTSGLSPRGRGKHLINIREGNRLRSIPAWAGETTKKMAREMLAAVYPRVGGGNAALAVDSWRDLGLSPRGRGKPSGQSCNRAGGRSIPAWAGETNPRDRAAGRAEVYPRVGGGNTANPCEFPRL